MAVFKENLLFINMTLRFNLAVTQCGLAHLSLAFHGLARHTMA